MNRLSRRYEHRPHLDLRPECLFSGAFLGLLIPNRLGGEASSREQLGLAQGGGDQPLGGLTSARRNAEKQNGRVLRDPAAEKTTMLIF